MNVNGDPIRTDLTKLAQRNACLRFEVSMLALALKAGFRPDQPRVPAGNPDGGQWIDDGNSPLLHRISRRRGGSGQVRIGRHWLPPGRPLSAEQKRQLDLLGRMYGCHGCGSVSDLSLRGHSIGDHQTPNALGKPTRVYPHCVYCSASQGGLISRMIRRWKHGN